MPTEPSQATAPDSPKADTVRRVLVIDDDAIIREYVLDGLSRIAGYEIMCASGGAEGLLLIESFRPTCVVADIYMPGIDGRKLTRALRGDGSIAATPVIFMSARTDPQTKMTALLSGGDDFLSKPFTISELYASVETAISITPEQRARRQRELSELGNRAQS